MQWESVIRRNIPFDALESQQLTFRNQVANQQNFGIFLATEPQPTFTAGRSAEQSDLLWSKDNCDAKGIALTPVSRGGKWTYHGPGQIVLYPIFRLSDVGLSSKDAKAYGNILGNALVSLLSSLNIPANFSLDPVGVFCEGRKIAAFGFNLSDGIATHGVALYLEPQNVNFAGIHPCGVPGASLTSLREENCLLDWSSVTAQLIDHIKKGLNPS